MAKPKENPRRINVFLSPADYTYLKDKAHKEGSNMSMLVRQAVKKYISISEKKE